MKYLKYILLLLFTIGFIGIVTFCNITRIETSTNKPGHEMPIPTVSYGYQISQQIVPTNSHIDSIVLFIRSLKCNTDQGYLSVSLLDSDSNTVFTNDIPLSELPEYGWFEALKNISVMAGDTYYLTVEAIDAIDDGPVISYYRAGAAASTEEEGQSLTYAKLPLDDCVLKLKVTYEVPLAKVEYMVYYVFLLFLMVFAYAHRPKQNKHI